MKTITIYRIFSYILITIAVILSIATLLALVVALANPSLLISVFISAAVVMYSFGSFLFLTSGIDGEKKQKQKLKDFIKVNAYVAVVFAAMNIFQAVTIIANPSLLNSAIDQVTALQTAPNPLPAAFMLKVMKAMIWFLLCYAIVLLIHIQITFRLLKQHDHLFESAANNDDDDIHPTRIN